MANTDHRTRPSGEIERARMPFNSGRLVMSIPTAEMGSLLGVPWPEKRVERFRRQVGIQTYGSGNHQPMSACETHQFYVYERVVHPRGLWDGQPLATQSRIWSPAVKAVAFLYSLGLYSPEEILDARWVLVDLAEGWRLFWDDMAAAVSLAKVGAGALVGLKLPALAFERVQGELANGLGYHTLSMS